MSTASNSPSLLLRLLIPVLECEGADRAEADAITAALACGLSHRLVPKGSDYPEEASIGESYSSYAELLCAHPNASSAKNTFVGIIVEDRAGAVHTQVRQDLPELPGREPYAQMLRDSLEFTGTVLGAGGTVHGMAGQEQLEGGAGQPQGCGGPGVDHHSLCYCSGARRDRCLAAFDLHEAQATGGERLFSLSNGT